MSPRYPAVPLPATVEIMPLGRDLEDPVVVGVGDEDVTRGVDGDALGVVELGPHGGTAELAPVPSVPVPAIRWMTPSGVISRTTLSPVSAMKTSPALRAPVLSGGPASPRWRGRRRRARRLPS